MNTIGLDVFDAISSNTHPSEIAHAFACGILLGFMPKDNLLWYAVFIMLYFVRIQKSVYTLMFMLGSLLAPLLDPMFDKVGWWILTQQSAEPVYRWLLNVPFVAFTKFNNTIVMGSLASGVVLYIPLYLLSRLFTMLWRKYAMPAIYKWRIIDILDNIPVVGDLIQKVGKK
jgi:uncharacterized protein (TIGR03546 family)